MRPLNQIKKANAGGKKSTQKHNTASTDIITSEIKLSKRLFRYSAFYANCTGGEAEKGGK